MNNALYLRRRSKIYVAQKTDGELLPLNYVASVSKNLEDLGFALSESLIEACRSLSLDELTILYQQLIADLKQIKGAHKTFKPMYPNFPSQVMAMSDVALYFNALLHYWTAGRFLPETEKKERLPLLDDVKLQIIELGTLEEFEALFGQIVSANASLSEQDKEDITWFVTTYGNSIARLLPDAIPQKENMAYVASLLLQHTTQTVEIIGQLCKTATDVLRLAVALSDGDVSLAKSTKFRNFSRAERKLLLGLVNRQANATEDMLRWKPRWIRLGERLHPGEYQKQYPEAAQAFNVLRNDLPFVTTNSQIEKALADKDIVLAIERLRMRAGDFARRLDHLLRLNAASQELVADAFGHVASKVSTPVLLQVKNHFKTRHDHGKLRVFFPKGNVAKAQAIENTLPELSSEICQRITEICSLTLIKRFQALPSLGKCYVDPQLQHYLAPFSQRSASKSFRTIVRGSQLPLPESNALRFFIWWKNGKERTDIDLSATLFDEAFNYIDTVSYYNLSSYGGTHSGDIVDAPNGASEFIDIVPEKVLEKDAAYVVMTLNSYTQQPYCELPECFAGWMARTEVDSGEIFEARTVQDKLDITADTRIAVPIIIDLINRKVVWCDLALKNDPDWDNNVAANLDSIRLMLSSMLELKKPNLYDLFVLHAQARGELVDSEALADTVFSVNNETPFHLETIASDYMQ